MTVNGDYIKVMREGKRRVEVEHWHSGLTVEKIKKAFREYALPVLVFLFCYLLVYVVLDQALDKEIKFQDKVTDHYRSVK